MVQVWALLPLRPLAAVRPFFLRPSLLWAPGPALQPVASAHAPSAVCAPGPLLLHLCPGPPAAAARECAGGQRGARGAADGRRAAAPVRLGKLCPGPGTAPAACHHVPDRQWHSRIPHAPSLPPSLPPCFPQLRRPGAPAGEGQGGGRPAAGRGRGRRGGGGGRLPPRRGGAAAAGRGAAGGGGAGWRRRRRGTGCAAACRGAHIFVARWPASHTRVLHSSALNPHMPASSPPPCSPPLIFHHLSRPARR